MNKLLPLIAVLATSLPLIACETAMQRIDRKENNLAAAGFTVVPANTPEREAELKQLPPNKFVPRTTGDQVEYIYADPVNCNCLYIGDQKAYGAYRQQMLTQHFLDEQQMTAAMYQNAWDWSGWNWGPWGRGWWR